MTNSPGGKRAACCQCRLLQSWLSDENADDFSCHDINKIRAKGYVTGELVPPCNTLMAYQTWPRTTEFLQCAAVLHFYLNL